ncbi:hypothetical protein HDU92_008321 [Lobulomyces angularis]|nr:hypothetical protein HDU92_008321 [Lobulomyces angularis]
MKKILIILILKLISGNESIQLNNASIIATNKNKCMETINYLGINDNFQKCFQNLKELFCSNNFQFCNSQRESTLKNCYIETKIPANLLNSNFLKSQLTFVDCLKNNVTTKISVNRNCTTAVTVENSSLVSEYISPCLPHYTFHRLNYINITQNSLLENQFCDKQSIRIKSSLGHFCRDQKLFEVDNRPKRIEGLQIFRSFVHGNENWNDNFKKDEFIKNSQVFNK